MEKLNLEVALLQSYNKQFDYDGVSGERLAYRLGEIAKIGLTAQNGSNRPGYSVAEKQAKDLVASWMRDAGLTVQYDGAGNVFGRLTGKQDYLPAILSGSHVDSVPNGGHFDGVLGVLSALEVVEAWKETGYQPDKPFEIAIFTDEEGARFNGGFNGSEAVVGVKDREEKIQQRDFNGESFMEVLESIGLTVDGYFASQRNLDEFEMFVEVHIEQGKRLEKENLPCGIVTGIAGPCWLEFEIIGEAGHAGNTPMNDRSDALVAASDFISEISKLPAQFSKSAVATVGKLTVEPNGVNVIPGKVLLYVDVRDIYKQSRDELVAEIISSAEKIATKHHVEITWEENMRVEPTPIADQTQERLGLVFKEKQIKPFYLPSGAGHDAMILGEKLPIAMIFAKSKAGISHNPEEWTDLNDCVQTVHVLKGFVEDLQRT